MSGWIKLPEEWPEDERVEELGSDAAMLHLSALGNSARHLTNGRVPRRALRRLWPVEDIEAAVAKLVDLEFWKPDDDGGYEIVDWPKYLLSSDEIEKRREVDRIRQTRKRRHDAGDHSMCDRCSYVRNNPRTSRDTSRDVTPPEPYLSDPNRTDPQGGEVRVEYGADWRSAGATRQPRLAGVGQHAALALTDPTAWDLALAKSDVPGDHIEICCFPAWYVASDDADSSTDPDAPAANRWIAQLGDTVTRRLADGIAKQAARHGCTNTNDHCDVEVYDDPDSSSFFGVVVPTSQVKPWTYQLTQAIEDAIA